MFYIFYINVCRWLDSNLGPLVSEAITLPTEQHPQPWAVVVAGTQTYDYLIDSLLPWPQHHGLWPFELSEIDQKTRFMEPSKNLINFNWIVFQGPFPDSVSFIFCHFQTLRDWLMMIRVPRIEDEQPSTYGQYRKTISRYLWTNPDLFFYI